MSPAVPKPPKPRPKKGRKPIRRSRVRQKAGKPRRFANKRWPALQEYVRGRPCDVGGAFTGICDGPTEAAHVRSRGAGGEDANNTVSLCRKHHREQHRIGIQSFETKYFAPGHLQWLAERITTGFTMIGSF